MELTGDKGHQELWHVDHAHKDTIRKAFFSPDKTMIVTCSETQHKVIAYIHYVYLYIRQGEHRM